MAHSLIKKLCIIFSFLFILLLVACDIDNSFLYDNNVVLEVKFDYCDGNIKTVSVKYNDTVNMPLNPTRENAIFSGWYEDSDYTKPYSFNLPLKTYGLTLYAKWDIDYISLTNKITTSIMKANVTVINKSYNTFLGIETTSAAKSGSGIIFQEAYDNYYLLTNNHVTRRIDGYNYQKITIEDYLGNTYTATKQHQSASYDLAVVYFKKSRELNVVSISNKNANINDFIVSLGQPKGQDNAITYGKVKNYKKINLSDTSSELSNVTFNVLAHDSPIAGGSSGGAVLNLELKIVGINYASTKDTFIYGYAIPAEKIREYLNTYIYK